MKHAYPNKLILFSAALSALLTAVTGSVAQPAVLYRNDFSTRDSSGAIGNGTFSLSYTNGSLINADAANPYAAQDMQDGWIRGKNGGAANLLVKTPDGNPCACICHTNADQFVFGLQQIANSLTDGVVRISCDMRPPRQWSGSQYNMSCSLGPDAFFAYSAEEYYKYYDTLIGIGSQSGSLTEFKFRCNDGDGAGVNAFVYGTAAVDTTHWYRFIADLTVTNNKHTVAVYDMGTVQPTRATATPTTPVETFGGGSYGFRMNLTPALGGITTLGVAAYGARGGNTGEIDIDLTARFDNITISFKPSGGTSFTEIYANDFASRTYTRLGTGTTAHTYAINGTDSGSLSYPLGDLVSTVTLAYPNGANGPVGTDGWARRHSGTSPMIVTTNAANRYLCVCDPNGTSLGFAVQRLGNCLTNGTARLTIDMRPPDKWYWSGSSSMRAVLGDDSLYRGEMIDASSDYFYQHIATTFGFGGTATTVRFRFDDGDGANSATSQWGTVSVNTTNWYRFVADLNLANNSVALNIYDLGATQPLPSTATPGTPVQTFTGGFRRNIGTGTVSLKGITTIGLAAYGTRGGSTGTSAPSETARFDNIDLKAMPTGLTEPTLIYANDFSSRTYTNLVANTVARLTGSTDMLSGGQDEWALRNQGTLYAYLSNSDGNPLTRFSSVGQDLSYSIQPLGTRVTANILCCQVDIRPPRYWNWLYQRLCLYLGDDDFWQGNRNDTLYFGKKWAVQFGFGGTSTVANAFGVYPNVSFLAANGNGTGVNSSNVFTTCAATTNWYRFKAEVNLAASTYKVKVFNLGTAHPVSDTPTPATPVATFENLKFNQNLWHTGDTEDKLDGISCVGLAAFGVRGGGLYPENETALVDNLLFSVKRLGTMIGIK